MNMKELFFEILKLYYLIIFLVSIPVSLMIDSDGRIYNDNGKNIRDFIRFIFMYQMAIWEYLKDEISIPGIVILETLTTFSVWFVNIFLFISLIAYMIFKLICYLFWIVFRKRNIDIKSKSDYTHIDWRSSHNISDNNFVISDIDKLD